MAIALGCSEPQGEPPGPAAPSLSASAGSSPLPSSSDHPSPRASTAASPSAVVSPAKVKRTRKRPYSPREDRKPLIDVPRVYAKTRNVWVRGKPTTRTQWIGFLWFGNSVALREPEPVPGVGCKGRWYAVQPRGYVCVDGDRATLDPKDPAVEGLMPFSPDPGAATPHAHYGESVGSPRYPRLPTDNTQSRKEWDSRLRKQRIAEALAGEPRHKSLLGVDLTQADTGPLSLPTLPRTLQQDYRRLIPGSAVAWSSQMNHDGRTWLLTDDLLWVPKDRIKPYAAVEFEGVHFSSTERARVAFFRMEDSPQYSLMQDGSLSESGKYFERLAAVRLTGKRKEVEDWVFHQVQGGAWLRADQAVVPRIRDRTPWGTTLYEEDTEESAPRGRGTWIDVSILEGWLVAYEGTHPVFATLMSPGRGGPPHGKIPTLKTASTPTGRFKITGKFVTSTMIAPNDLVHAAVPWAQNFKGPYALHGAYWHNDWGKRKSGGCVNVSPKDGQWLFHFTEPKIPQGWHGLRWLPKKEAATTLLVGR